jgi:hypothetical protein
MLATFRKLQLRCRIYARGTMGLSEGDGTATRAEICYLSREEKDTVRVADERGDGK